MHVFKVLFLYFREIEQYFRPRADLRGNNQRLNFTENKLQRMSMAAMERYYTKHQQNEDDPCLKLRWYARERFFFFGKNLSSLQRSILSWVQSLPDRSRKSVTNEIFEELCKITSILLVQIIGDPYFFNHESLTLLTIYKIWWNEKNSHRKKLSFFNIFFPRAIEFR